VYLNNLEDLIFKGKCMIWGSPVARYIETGENPESAAMAKHIREVLKKYKRIKKG
jgi:GH35 family endo-1,4-beta-xylanase